MHLDHVGQLGHPDRDRNVLAADAAGQPAAVEPLEGEPQRRLNVGAQTHPLGQQGCGRAVRVDQPRQLAARIDQ